MSTPNADEPDARRDPLINITGQTGDVKIGDVAGGDMYKAGRDLIMGDQIVHTFTPRPVAATPDELAAAQQRLAALPTDAVPPAQDTLPPGSWLSQLTRNQQFVGREADLLALAQLLKGGQSVAVNQAASAVASGLGGIGKTQLAIEFVYRYGSYFAGVFWLNFAQPGAVDVEIAACGGLGRLELFNEAANLKLAEQINLVKARWVCGLPYLLIFDNCEDPHLVRKHYPGGATRVLITSRNPDWPGDLGVQKHALGVLQRAESIELLRQHRPALTDEEAGELAAELGDLPLALHLAGRFLEQYGRVFTLEEYLSELRSPRLFERLPLREQDGTLPTGHNRDVARTFALSYERLDKQDVEDILALRLLTRAAFLVPGESMPAALLRMSVEGYFDNFEARLTAEAAVRRLVRIGLLEDTTGEGVRMHRLLGAYVRQVSTDEHAQIIAEDTVLSVSKAIVDAPGAPMITAFLPILRRVTDAALPRGDERTGALCLRLGRYLENLGLYATAQFYVETGLAIYEQLFGLEHVDTATSLNNLGALCLQQGDYERARQLLAEALTVREKLFDPEHTDIAQTLTNLASLDYAQENYLLARWHLEQALTINERLLGGEHHETAITISNLAAVEQKLGNDENAHSLFERALTTHQKVLGVEHPDTIASMINLASFLVDQGNFAAAFPLYQQALAIGERVLGPTHPWTANNLAGLATFYLQQDDVSSAYLYMEQALTIRHQILGPTHPDTVSTEQAVALMIPEVTRRQVLLADMREELAPLLLAIAWVTVGEEELRPVVIEQLVSIEEHGWMIRELVERIWAGERNFDIHTTGLDERDKAFLNHVLKLIGAYERGERILSSRAMATLPEAVRAAVEAKDNQSLDTALGALLEEKAHVIIDCLIRGGLVEKPTQPSTEVDEALKPSAPGDGSASTEDAL